MMFICEEQGGYFVAYEGKVVNTPNSQVLYFAPQKPFGKLETTAGRSTPSQLAPIMMLRGRIPIGKAVGLGFRVQESGIFKVCPTGSS